MAGNNKGINTKRGQSRPGDGATEVKPPSSGSGNTKADSEWLRAHFSEMERIGEDEQDIPFGAEWRWTGGLQEDLDASGHFASRMANPCNSRSYLRDKEGRYVVDAENGPLTRPCLRACIPGADVCVTHGGYNPQVRANARARIAGASDAIAGRLLAIALNKNTSERDAIAACNSLLDRAGIKGGVEVDLTMPGWQEGLRKLFEGKYEEEDGRGAVS